jgi:hypothetical protein
MYIFYFLKCWCVYLVKHNFIFSRNTQAFVHVVWCFSEVYANRYPQNCNSFGIGRIWIPFSISLSHIKEKFLTASNSFQFRTSAQKVQFYAPNVRIGMGSWWGTEGLEPGSCIVDMSFTQEYAALSGGKETKLRTERTNHIEMFN